MSAIHAIPMTTAEILATRKALYTRKIRLEGFVTEMHKKAECLPDAKEELEIINVLYARLTERLDKIEICLDKD